MSGRSVFVLDASVGVKWFKFEAGSEAARALYLRAVAGEIDVAAPVHFAHEVLSVVQREMTARAVPEAWGHLNDSGIALVPLGDEVVDEAASQADALRCSFYDALAPACAHLLSATLVSADARAHGNYPGVVIIE